MGNGRPILSYLTGLPTHMAVGSSVPYTHDRAALAALPRQDRAGAEFLLDYLRDRERPAYISMVGSCRDLAIAAKLDPNLFRNKCAGIYLNAGTGHPDVAKQGGIEYNVRLCASSSANWGGHDAGHAAWRRASFLCSRRSSMLM